MTDPGHASCTALYDLAAGAWSERALGVFGVPREALPEVVADARSDGRDDARSSSASPCRSARARATSRPRPSRRARTRPARAKLTLGTSAMLDVHAGAAGGELPRRPARTRSRSGGSGPAARDTLCLEGTAITAGAALDWLARIGLLPEAKELDALAAPSTGGAWFVPALAGLGTPHMDFAARGTLGGLSLATGRAGARARRARGARAPLRRPLRGARASPTRSLPVDGGLAQSDVLLQLLADLTGAEVRRAAEVETTAFGAAQLAGLAVGALRDLAACRALSAPAVRLLPKLAEAERRRRARALEGARRSLAKEPDAG